MKKNGAIIPKARGGLLTTEHHKRGTRFITVCDPQNNQVALLEDWEYAALVLCDGERAEDEILELLSSGELNEVINKPELRRCLKFFESKTLIEPLGLLRTQTIVDSPRTMAELQLAYEEWHKEPVATGQFPSWLAPWSAEEPQSHPPSMEPTMTQIPLPRAPPVQVGSTIELDAADSLLVNPVVPREKIEEEPTDSPNSLKPNTQAHKILSAVYSDESEELASEYEAPKMNILFAVDEAVSAVEQSDAAAIPLTASSPAEKPMRFSQMEDSATVQVRTVSSAPPDDRAQTRVAKSQPPARRMETVATTPGYEPIFRTWINHTREQMSARPLGSLVPLRRTLVSFDQNRWSDLAKHVDDLMGLLPHEDALDTMALALRWAKARGQGEPPPAQSEDAAALLADILRSAKSAGVCAVCLQKQTPRFLQCSRCGFRTGGLSGTKGRS